MKGILYLVATPIGNLEDISLRAIRILKEVDYIAAEDTRHTLKLLNHLEIKKTLISYYKEKESIKANILIEKLLEGKNIALVSDAGTPAISDPGEFVVKEAIKKDIKIVPIPGACAFISALIASGQETKEIHFIGFLPVNKKEKREKLKKLKNCQGTIIFYEAPHKLEDTLKIMMEIFGNRKATIAREITKIHEEFIRGTFEEIIEKCKEPRGEYVIVVDGLKDEDIENEYENLSIEEHYEFYKKRGFEKKEIIKKIAKDRKTSRNEIYKSFFN